MLPRPSHPGSQQQSQSPLCLPLLKFSYATVSNESIAPIPWIHLSSKNALFAIFETSPTQYGDGRTEERPKFRILQDPETLEELDLSVLSAEARRSLAQPPTLMNANVPHVAVVVKVPLIAVKYPMSNGQLRRFQIRFASNEDYYEAMKMLSRANVPTVEAGTFPTQRLQSLPRPPTTNILTPHESASQIGVSNEAPASYARGPLSLRNDTPNDALRTHFPAGLLTMPPPSHPPVAMDPVQYHSAVHSSTLEQLQMQQNSGARNECPKSNISLSTATTLVATKDHQLPNTIMSHGSGTMTRPQQADLDRQRIDRYTPQRPSNASRVEQDVGLSMPPRRDLPFPIRKWGTNGQDSPKSPDNRAPASCRNQPREVTEPLEAEVDGSRSVSSTAKGKRKRAPTKAAPTVKTTVKKPRAATTRKKVSAKPPQPETPVPTLEELLQRPGYSSLRCTTRSLRIPDAQKAHPATEQKSNVKVSISEPSSPTREVGQAGSPSLVGTIRRMTRSASRSLAHIPTREMREPREPDSNVYRSEPCTPADQIIAPRTPDPPAASAYPSAAMEPAATPATDAREQASVNLPSSPQIPDALLHQAHCILASDPQFANAHERLHAWSSLPEPTRNTAVNSYFCRLIMDPNFGKLCKTVDLFWEGVLLERRMEEA